MSNYVSEWCPYCCVEVSLEGEMKIQNCPSCNELILPCSICELNGCKHCPFDK